MVITIVIVFVVPVDVFFFLSANYYLNAKNQFDENEKKKN